jgi:hypothetical protein
MAGQKVIDSLLESCESLYFQSIAMESILNEVAPEDWHHMMETMMKCDEAIRLRASFHRTLQSAVRIGDPMAVLAALRPKSPCSS